MATALVVGVSGVVVNAGFTVWASYRLVQKFRSPKPTDATLYENVDGTATEESQQRYEAAVPTVTLSCVTFLGLACALAVGVLTAAEDHLLQEATPTVIGLSWAFFVSWLFIAVQTLATLLERTPSRRYNLARNGAVASAVQLAIVAVAALQTLQFGTAIQSAVMGLSLAELLMAVILMLTFTRVPAHPDVYVNEGRPVDRMNSASLLSRNAYAWADSVLALAAKKRSDLQVEDLPFLQAITRAANLEKAFNSMALKDNVDLALRILWFRRGNFFAQYVLSVTYAFLDFGPQYAMMMLLRTLERRTDPNAPVDGEVWFWVAVFGLAGLCTTFCSSRLNWVAWANGAIPVRAALSSLIFSKAMRRKATAEPPSDEEDDKDAKKADDKDKEKKAGTDQETINLLAIDVNEIHNFCYFSMLFVMLLVRLVISITFLWTLVGWQAILAGLATNVMTLPYNTYLSKRYTGFQKEIMKARDKRTKVIREALNGVRQIKFSAVEDEWEKKINEVRDEELSILWKLFSTDAWMRLSFTAGPPFLAAASLGVYSLIYGQLAPSVAFTSIGVFMGLESAIGQMPELISYALNCKVSCDRVHNFLTSPEREVIRSPAHDVSLDHATVAFPSDAEEPPSDRFMLRDVTLKFPKNELSVISGKTGSGKSLLLSAILGEVDLISGNIYTPKCPPPAERYDDKATADNWIIPSAMAFVSQTPWIENASIKDNILFGLPFDNTRYERVLKAAALVKDLEMFEDGDKTEVGAQGISLSGGQRWRLTMARALYSRAGILVLDDIFSALDAHVGKEIFENGLTGDICQGRTRILVTHHVALCLSKTKYSVRLVNGTVEYAGSVEELKQDGDLDKILMSEAAAEAEDQAEAVAETEAAPEQNGTSTENGAKPKDDKTPKKLIEDEKRESGSVKRRIYHRYLKASGGYLVWGFMLLTYIASQALGLTRSWWIKLWTSTYDAGTANDSHLLYTYTPQVQMSRINYTSTELHTETIDNGTLTYFLGGYVILSLIFVVIATARYLFIYVVGLRASRVVFREMTFQVLRMPLRWIDTVPLGRILNRFTSDVTTMDGRLTHELAMLGAQFFELLGIFVAGIIVSPYIIVLAIILIFISAKIAQSYLDGAREVKRLESTRKSPMYEHFGSSLKGLTTIRAFDKSTQFVDRMYDSIDKHTTTWWHNWLFNRWIGFRLGIMGNFFSTAVAAVVVSISQVDASMAGFALAFALSYTNSCIMTVRIYASSQISMNSTERVLEYTDLKTEAQGGDDVPATWPPEGKIEVKDLVIGYAEDLPAILKGLNFKVDKNERVGVVGRTGAGKSTLSLALFRFLEAREGQILVDGIDISKIKLNALRTRLAVIPQDPVLFSGTIRSNLDPFNNYSDDELMRALRSVHLTSTPGSTPPNELADGAVAEEEANANIFSSLSSPISDGGQNISQGQRQLLCLAREIVSRPKIMILDEATSAVDMATDGLIQRSIREEFTNTTLLVIAHRLSTVADFDKILVMGDGKAVEFGSPRELLELDGVFAGMVASSGEVEKLKEIILG